MVAALEETAAQPGKALVFDVTELDTPDRRVVVGRGDQDKGEGPTTTTIPRRSKLATARASRRKLHRSDLRPTHGDPLARVARLLSAATWPG